MGRSIRFEWKGGLAAGVEAQYVVREPVTAGEQQFVAFRVDPLYFAGNEPRPGPISDCLNWKPDLIDLIGAAEHPGPHAGVVLKAVGGDHHHFVTLPDQLSASREETYVHVARPAYN